MQANDKNQKEGSNQERIIQGHLPTSPTFKGLEAISRVLAEINIHTYFKPGNTIRSIVLQANHRVPLLNKSRVVYKVECGCCKAPYAGETNRKLGLRLAERQNSIHGGEVNASALVQLAWSLGAHVNWDSMKILGVSGRHYSRLSLEAIHISRQKNSFNHDNKKS